MSSTVLPVSEREARVPLPARYATAWRPMFQDAIRERLSPGATVLDIGSGRHPSLAAAERRDARWVGLDLSEDELRRAPEDAYQERVVADLSARVDSLAGSIDLAVSWQVLEHVKPLGRALDNVYAYLKPGGQFVALFSGGFSAFAIVNRLLPDRLGHTVVSKIMRRPSDGLHPVFPAYYDRCYASALERMFAGWSHVSIEPHFRGAVYFHFSAALQRAYLAYESAAARRGLDNLATHYFVVAQK
ncbi:class I SAM-dependent methyltransferase [Solirubrobacter phytolaccae]|uniref:Class I SAM-dependent methyltransferase n=1 Tax=Solirubrobacter phytolaccae TaxID=1404360 RepID=A0A9X3N9M9_9ACTN|nr:class I SAM-dependent methyltransferase [Solirubrobacter phytolaccae]MDA0182368.1 class I SAM-dependent methyltransferase [Solirubrobacter phytolaccae]